MNKIQVVKNLFFLNKYFIRKYSKSILKFLESTSLEKELILHFLWEKKKKKGIARKRRPEKESAMMENDPYQISKYTQLL